MGSYRCRSLIEGLYIPYRSPIEALYTLNSPPVVSLKKVTYKKQVFSGFRYVVMAMIGTDIKTIEIATLEEMLTRILHSEILKSCICWCVQKNICECLKCTRIAMRLLRVLNGRLSSHFARRRRENENRQMSFSVRRGTLLRVRSSVLEGVGEV